MVEVYQEDHDGCLRACIATILEVSYEDVPEVTRDKFRWLPDLNDKLIEKFGYELIPLGKGDEYVGILIGVVPSTDSGGHAVVMVGCGSYDVLAFDPARHIDAYRRQDPFSRYVLEKVDS